MALTATYDSDLSRVRLSADSLGASATYAYVWRSLSPVFNPYVTVRGGDHIAVSGGQLLLDDYEFEVGVPMYYAVQSYDAAGAVQFAYQAGPLTVDLTGVWLKVVARPFLNRQVVVQSVSAISRRSRGGVFDVVGRSFPVAVSDVRGAHQYTLSVLTETDTEREDIDALLASGEPVFVHVPAAETKLRGGYYVIGDSTEEAPGRLSTRRIFDLPLTEVAAPDATIVGATSTWQTVLDNYATWADLIADKATWADVLELVGDPSEVIVP